MADSTLTVSVNADISGLESGMKSAVDLINSAFKTTGLNAQYAKGPVADLFKSMQSSSDRAIAAMVKGTETWRKALSNIGTDLEIKFIQLASHRILNWAAAELGMTKATEAGNAERASSDEAASGVSIGAMAEKAVTSIFNDAKQVFGGIFAFLAPLMGPAAAGPAAAGSASVAALASGITYAESGAWNIPSNTLAYLHAGEMVVPRPFASSLRDGNGLGSGAGDSYTINVNAIDTQTGAQFLKNNASLIATAISSQVRNFNRHLPAWKT